jgi:hypothetical protein
MKNVALGSLIALTTITAAGCTTKSSGAVVSATWSIKTTAGSSATCPPGFDTAALYNQEVNATTLVPIGQPIIDLFDCAAGRGSSAPLPAAVYQTWVEIANHDNTQVYAQSLSAIVDVVATDKTFSAEILTDGGYFLLSWDLIGASSNQPLSCAQAGAAGGVEAVSTDVASSTNTASDIFTCDDHQGVTSGFKAATYTVSVAALNAGMQSIGTAPTLTNKRINAPNKVTDLGNLMIPITGK